MGLFRLPHEIMDDILHLLDPGSFYACLITSRRFRAHALESINLLYDQLARISGPDVIETSDTAVLLREFRRRAAKLLITGPPSAISVHEWLIPSSASRKESMLANWNTEGTDSLIHNLGFIEVHPMKPLVNVYFMQQRDEGGYTPHLKYSISPINFFRADEESPAYLHVVKAAWCYPRMHPIDLARWRFDLRIAVLCRYYVPSDRSSPERMRLFILELDWEFGPVVITTFDLDSADLDRLVVALALTTRLVPEPIILFREVNPLRHNTVSWTRSIIEDCLTWERLDTFPVFSSTCSNMGYMVGMCTRGQSVHFLPLAFPIPHWTLRRSESCIAYRDWSLPDTAHGFMKNMMGIPFAYTHHCSLVEDAPESGFDDCFNTILELMIGRMDHAFTEYDRDGAFILKAFDVHRGCNGFDPDEDDLDLSHFYVARLVDLPDLHNLSTLGYRIAVSPKGYRIAIASWKTVRVWAIDPMAFLDPSYSLSGGRGVPGDFFYTERCGWQYYKTEDIVNGCVELKPIELPSVGVVYGLEFHGEDELWGWTERGLCRWNFGASGTGERCVA